MQVEIHAIHDAVVLRKAGSELLILSSHVTELKKRQSAKEFSSYFMSEALINRPARKLFENWLRKDSDLWRRLFKTVQTLEQSSEATQESKPEVVAPTKASKAPTTDGSKPTKGDSKEVLASKSSAKEDSAPKKSAKSEVVTDKKVIAKPKAVESSVKAKASQSKIAAAPKKATKAAPKITTKKPAAKKSGKK